MEEIPISKESKEKRIYVYLPNENNVRKKKRIKNYLTTDQIKQIKQVSPVDFQKYLKNHLPLINQISHNEYFEPHTLFETYPESLKNFHLSSSPNYNNLDDNLIQSEANLEMANLSYNCQKIYFDELKSKNIERDQKNDNERIEIENILKIKKIDIDKINVMDYFNLHFQKEGKKITKSNGESELSQKSDSLFHSAKLEINPGNDEYSPTNVQFIQSSENLFEEPNNDPHNDSID